MMENSEIKLVTIPKIEHHLKLVGESVTQRLEDLNINSLVAVESTVKSLKDLRADLNKELANFEEQRKFVKNGVLSPYNEFEEIYKTEIAEKYKGAISLLKDKIEAVETKVKDEKKGKIETYFNELCTSENIDFISFDKVGLDINLSTSEKAYREKCNEFISRVHDDLLLINSTDFKAEALVEYKATLNASKAITTVKERKASEQLESDRLRQAELTRRVNLIKSLSMVFVDITNAYEYDAEIYITKATLEDLSTAEFQRKYVELEDAIKTKKTYQTPSAQAEAYADATSNQIEKPAAAIPAPTVAEEIVSASFEVKGTMSQLRALGQYMKQNSITYKNI